MTHGRCRRHNHTMLILAALAAMLVLLTGCGSTDQPPSGDPTDPSVSNTTTVTSVPTETSPSEPTETMVPSVPETEPLLGWQEIDDMRCYILEDGARATGWQELDGERYYFDENGAMQTGWLKLEDTQYYLCEDGAMATGQVEIDGEVYYFSSAGVPVLVANPWNYIPDDYAPDLVELSQSISVEGSRVDRSCYDSLVKMIEDCNEECPEVCVVSSYRTMEHQTNNYKRKVNYYLGKGYAQEEAESKAAAVVAIPGTSEHQLGLAVDIIDTRLWSLVEEQEDLPGQQWLMENCWKYGFILRYPKDKTNVTGIIYEPWHYRYVGEAVAKELHESGLTLEEYLENLTD